MASTSSQSDSKGMKLPFESPALNTERACSGSVESTLASERSP
jgi:hypothetical protein